jgi:DUF1680 family protein
VIVSTDADAIGEGTADGLSSDIVALRLPASQRRRVASSWWPYADASTPKPAEPVGRTEQIELTAIPYFAWGNRGSGAMRIWLPTS